MIGLGSDKNYIKDRYMCPTSKAAQSKHSYLCIKKPAGMLNAKCTMHLAELTLRTKFRYFAERCAFIVRDLALWCHS